MQDLVLPNFACARAVLVLALLAACGNGDDCSSFSEFSCKEIEQARYNVHFYFPSGTEHSLGQVSGLSRCDAVAHNYAAEKEVSNENWGYICCMIAHGSACYEKHKATIKLRQ